VTHFTPAEAIARMDEGGVDAAVIHPRGGTEFDPDGAASGQGLSGAFAIMGALPSTDRNRATHRDVAGTAGYARLRYGFLSDPAGNAQGRTIDWLWERRRRPASRSRCWATGLLVEIAGSPSATPGFA